MNDSEKRRRRLLDETRNLYSERGFLPAIHPRYQSTYDRLYREEESAGFQTFGIRVFLCFLLFAAYVTMDNGGMTVKNVDSKRIVQEIEADVDVAQVWQNL